MKWNDWEPLYDAIRKEFGYARGADEACARRLDALLARRRNVGLEGLRRRLGGKTVVIAGPAEPRALQQLADTHVVVACDSATTTCLQEAVLPGVIVSDLDGDPDDLAWANDRGSILAVHAHGDNLEVVEALVPEFAGPLLGTTQAEPFGRLVNAGGFTDGDRACFLAAAAGARELLLTGFDFERPARKEGKDGEIKRRKLEWARRLIEIAAREVQLRFV